VTLTGSYCRLERLDPGRHAGELFAADRADTAWYAIVDADWPRVREAFRAWLASDNFEPDGRQRTSLKAAR
jgi:hypothetical protein